MMIIVRIILLLIITLSFAKVSYGHDFKDIYDKKSDRGHRRERSYYKDEDIPITTDSRIKRYIYSENEVYLLVLHVGFQSHIEFAKNETIQSLIPGDTYSWKLNPIGNRLFIKPMESNMQTNITIITNKRTYHFDLSSVELVAGHEKDLVYVIKFHYPRRKSR